MSLVRFRFWALVLDIMGRQVRTDHKCRCGSMVEHQPSKLNTWVRFPSPALRYRFDIKCASGSVGGARPCQGRGRGFESRLALFVCPVFTGLFSCHAALCTAWQVPAVPSHKSLCNALLSILRVYSPKINVSRHFMCHRDF